MNFKSAWITTERFANKRTIKVFHKEVEQKKHEKSDVKNYHVHFRKKILINSTQDVRMNISADDYYKLYINGKYICQGPAPAYYDSYNYNRVNISKYVKKGMNTIAVHVYYQGLINRVWNSGDNRQGMIADIYEDGVYICGTDSSWRYSEAKEYSGNIIGYDTAYLENINFCRKENSWQNSGFDDSDYIQAIELQSDDHKFQDEPAECLEVYCVKPKEIVRTAPGEFFLDFGKEIIGQFYMCADGNKGEKVTIMCGEECEQDNPYRVRYKMRCGCDYIEECTLSGKHDCFEFYDYKAFRYVNVISDCVTINENDFCAIVRNHKFDIKVELCSDIKYLKEIWDLCVHTIKCGAQEGFLDCLSREKGQYLGDFTVSGLAYMYLTGDYRSYKKTLFDFARTTKVCPGLMSVAPCSHMQEIADYSLQYPLQVLNYYRYTKDVATVRELYPVLCGLLDYFKSYERLDGLLEKVDEKWNLVDWPSNLRDGYSINGENQEISDPCHNVINAFYIYAIRCVNEIKNILGEPIDDKAERLTKAYIEAFYDEKRKLFYDTEERNHAALHSNVLAVLCGAAPENSKETIKVFIKSRGFCCGTMFSYFVMKALAKLGEYDDILRLLTNESEHSWVNMIKEGATTCFEAWGKEQKWNSSLCHPWSCSPIIIILEDILKVKPEQFECGSAHLRFSLYENTVNREQEGYV